MSIEKRLAWTGILFFAAMIGFVESIAFAPNWIGRMVAPIFPWVVVGLVASATLFISRANRIRRSRKTESEEHSETLAEKRP